MQANPDLASQGCRGGVEQISRRDFMGRAMIRRQNDNEQTQSCGEADIEPRRRVERAPHAPRGCRILRRKMGLERSVSKRKGSPYRSGRSKDWLKFKNPAAPAVKREAEEDWGKGRWR